jgi:hypothetical protein
MAPTNRDISIKLEAMSPLAGVTIDEVGIFYFASDNELNIEKTKGDTLYLSGGDSESGTFIALESDEAEMNLWKGTIPGQSSTTYLYYWVVATDSQGNMTSSPAYTLKIEDLEEANLMVNLAFWLSILFTLVGMLFILIFIKFSKKMVFARKKEGLLIMGGEEGFGLDVETESDLSLRKKIKTARGIVFIALIIITLVLVTWSITNNLYDDIVYVVEGGL